PIHAEFGDAIEAYRQVALEELRRPAGGRPDSGADEIIERLWLILARFEPTTAGQAELQTRAFDAVEELGDARRALQLAVRRTPPPIIWVFLAGGAAAVITLAAISSVGGRLPAVYLAVLTAVVALALYAIYALAYPVRTGLLADPSRHSESLLTRPSAASAAGEHSRSAPTLRWPRSPGSPASQAPSRAPRAAHRAPLTSGAPVRPLGSPIHPRRRTTRYAPLPRRAREWLLYSALHCAAPCSTSSTPPAATCRGAGPASRTTSGS